MEASWEEGTLSQFLASIANTKEKSESRFKRIVDVNTTTGKTSETAARIADEALNALHGLLDESICVVPGANFTGLP
jgi:hypothetical protein